MARCPCFLVQLGCLPAGLPSLRFKKQLGLMLDASSSLVKARGACKLRPALKRLSQKQGVQTRFVIGVSTAGLFLSNLPRANLQAHCSNVMRRAEPNPASAALLGNLGRVPLVAHLQLNHILKGPSENAHAFTLPGPESSGAVDRVGLDGLLTATGGR